MISFKLRDRVHLLITRRNTKEEHTLSHKAHFSLHQSAMWSEIKRQPVLTKPLCSPGRSCLCPGSHNHYTGTWSQKKVSSASLLTSAGVGRRQASFKLAFWQTERQLCSFLCSQLLQLSWETIRATNIDCPPRARHVLSQATHRGMLRRFHKKDKSQRTAGSGGT